MAAVHFQVLGPVGAHLDGHPLGLGGARQRSVVARLLVAHGRTVAAETLVNDLWEADLQPRAMASLQAQVSHLRRVLEPDRPPRAPAVLLVSAPPGYALRTDQVDAVRFEATVAEADAVLSADPLRATRLFQTAATHWHGAAYEEFADRSWAAAEAARLDGLRLAATEWHAAAQLEAGDPVGALSLLATQVTDHPLREEGWRLTALALYRDGRQAEALEALRRARLMLVEHLGVDPGPELAQMESDILAQTPHLMGPRAQVRVSTDPETARGTAGTASSGPAPSDVSTHPIEKKSGAGPSLVGRAVQLEAVRGAAAQALGGGLRVVVVTGGPGEGKTALLAATSAEASIRGFTPVTVRCPETDGAPGGWPWLVALRAVAVNHPPTDPTVQRWLRDTPSADDGDSDHRRFLLHQAVTAWLGDIAAQNPLLIVIDDAHRADDETGSLLTDVALGLVRAPVLLLVGHRPDPGRELQHALAVLAELEPERIELGGLSADEVSRLAEHVATTRVTPAVASQIHARSGGNPFFVRQLVRLFDSGAPLTDVPDTVRDVVRRRVAILPSQTGSLLQLAAVAGREFDAETLVVAAGLGASGAIDDDAVVQALEAALISGLLVERDGGAMGFTHDLVRETLYEDLSGLRRTRLHGRIAAAVRQVHPTAVPVLAHHFGRSGPAAAAEAARYAELAAVQAENRYAYADAARWWEQAARSHAVADPGDDHERTRLSVRWIGGVQRTGDIPRARAMRSELLATATALDEAELTAAVLLSCDSPTGWSVRDQETPDHRLIDIAASTVVRLPKRPDLQARLLALVARELESSDDERGDLASRQALDLAREVGDPAVLADALDARYLWTYFAGPAGTPERRLIGRELLVLARRYGLSRFETVAHFIGLQVAADDLDLVAADDHARDLARTAAAYGNPLLGAISGFWWPLRAVLTGDDDSGTRYEQAAADVAATGWWESLALLLGLLGVSGPQLAITGTPAFHEQIGPLRAHLPSAARDVTAEWHAAALAAAGLTRQARAELGVPGPVRRNYLAPLLWAFRGLAGLGTGDLERQKAAYEALLPYTGTVCGAWTASVCVGPTDALLARLALGAGDATAAVRHADDATAIAVRLGNASWQRLAGALRDRAVGSAAHDVEASQPPSL